LGPCHGSLNLRAKMGMDKAAVIAMKKRYKSLI
jgi:hypothetical protein